MFSRRSSDPKTNQSELKRAEDEEFPHKLSLGTKLAFSFGHVQNDLCAAIWFSFILLYFNDTTAGLLLFLGQGADAISTPLIGYASDKNLSIFGNYGRRKVWHLIGTVFVTASFPLIFSSCILCSNASPWEKFLYYSIFIALFQFGWAAVQVAHLSLITDLSNVSSERVELNAYRQAASVASSICVYTITLLLLGIDDSTISKKDSVVFMKVVHLITGIGIIFTVLFHIFVKEPSHKEEWELKAIEEGVINDSAVNQLEARTQTSSGFSANSASKDSNEGKEATLLEKGLDKSTVLSVETDQPTTEKPLKRDRNHRIWSDWLTSFSFWKICIIYMLSRLYVNVTQVYTPLYLQETLLLAKRNIAIVPFITYFAGFIFSLLCKSRKINAKIIMCSGCFFGFISCVWIWYCYLQISIWEVFVMAAVFGIGGTFMLIGSLSMTSDLIDDNKISGAFVFGLMSFFDKLINGSVIALVQHLKPISGGIAAEDDVWNATVTPLNVTSVVQSDGQPLPGLSDSNSVFYLYVLVFVSGAAVIGTFLTLAVNMRKEARKLWHSVKRVFSRAQ